MATGTDSADLPPSRGGPDLEVEEGESLAGYDDSAGSDLEEGEFVPEHDDRAASDAESRHDGDGRPGIKRPRLEFEGIVVDGGALSSPSPTPSRDRDSYGTISYVDASLASLGLKPLVFPCPVCRREFTTQRGMSIHMSVHGPHERQQWNKERTPAISGGLDVAGEMSSVGRRSVFFPRSEGVVDSMAMVVPEPVIDPMPIAFASSSSSAEPSPRNDDSMAILVESPHNPTSQVVVHPPCSSQFLQGHQPAAPQVVLAQAQPTVSQGQQLAEAAAAPPQFVVHQPAARQVVAHQVQRILPPPPALAEPGRWVRKEKECDQRRFGTDQGLGGPMPGSKRRNNEATDWGLDLHLGVGDPAKLHPCKYCTGVFTSGAQLSGHMRKHYAGNATPQKLASALELSLSMPSAAMEVTPGQRPAVEPSRPAVRRHDVLRIFGVDIEVPPPGATANGTSSVVTETDQIPAASSTDIEQ
ncbi:hypothetical protein ACQ4PT_042175 [Festuca glaucescens]